MVVLSLSDLSGMTWTLFARTSTKTAGAGGGDRRWLVGSAHRDHTVGIYDISIIYRGFTYQNGEFIVI